MSSTTVSHADTTSLVHACLPNSVPGKYDYSSIITDPPVFGNLESSILTHCLHRDYYCLFDTKLIQGLVGLCSASFCLAQSKSKTKILLILHYPIFAVRLSYLNNKSLAE